MVSLPRGQSRVERARNRQYELRRRAGATLGAGGDSRRTRQHPESDRRAAQPAAVVQLEVAVTQRRAENIAVANVSAHLACLTGCGLVRSQRRGKFVYYQLQERRVRDLLKLADAILANVSRQMYECVHAGR